MITIEPVTEGWDSNLTDYSAAELERIGRDGLDKLELAQIRLFDEVIIIACLVRYSLLSVPHIGILLCKSFKPRVQMLKALHRYMNEVAPVCETTIQPDYQEGIRLALWWGFKPTGQFMTIAGTEYEVYRRNV